MAHDWDLIWNPNFSHSNVYSLFLILINDALGVRVYSFLDVFTVSLSPPRLPHKRSMYTEFLRAKEEYQPSDETMNAFKDVNFLNTWKSLPGEKWK